MVRTISRRPDLSRQYISVTAAIDTGPSALSSAPKLGVVFRSRDEWNEMSIRHPRAELTLAFPSLRLKVHLIRSRGYDRRDVDRDSDRVNSFEK